MTGAEPATDGSFCNWGFFLHNTNRQFVQQKSLLERVKVMALYSHNISEEVK